MREAHACHHAGELEPRDPCGDLEVDVPVGEIPAVPKTAATICSTWLVPTAASGTNPASTIIGTEKSGPPAPDSPEPNPDAAPTPTSIARSPGARPSRKRARVADGNRM